jgi:hypothetical protein
MIVRHRPHAVFRVFFFSGKDPPPPIFFYFLPTPMNNEILQTTWAKAEITAVSTAQSQSSMHVGPVVAALASTVIPYTYYTYDGLCALEKHFS